VYRNLPEYDHSVGPLPATEVDNTYLLKRYGVTKPTLFKRRDALVENGWVKPERLGQRVYYSPLDVGLLDSVHFWAKQGYSLTEVVAHLKQQKKEYEAGEAKGDGENVFEGAAQQTVTVDAQNTTTDLVVKGVPTALADLKALFEELGDGFSDRVADKVGDRVGEVLAEKLAAEREVLAGHDFLAKAADRKYLLTGKVVAAGLGVKTATVSGWPDRHERFGFEVVRVGKGQYRVERLPEP
jgi:DNA-binding transcriptional MerR regulator